MYKVSLKKISLFLFFLLSTPVLFTPTYAMRNNQQAECPNCGREVPRGRLPWHMNNECICSPMIQKYQPQRVENQCVDCNQIFNTQEELVEHLDECENENIDIQRWVRREQEIDRLLNQENQEVANFIQNWHREEGQNNQQRIVELDTATILKLAIEELLIRINFRSSHDLTNNIPLNNQDLIIARIRLGRTTPIYIAPIARITNTPIMDLTLNNNIRVSVPANIIPQELETFLLGQQIPRQLQGLLREIVQQIQRLRGIRLYIGQRFIEREYLRMRRESLEENYATPEPVDPSTLNLEKVAGEKLTAKMCCSICLKNMLKVSKNKPNKEFVSTKCNHIFCKKCLFRWLKVNQSCPCCRAKIEKKSETFEEEEEEDDDDDENDDELTGKKRRRDDNDIDKKRRKHE